MTLSRGRHQPKMSAGSTEKSSGWTAFHQKQLQRQDVGAKPEVDIYPPLVSSSSPTRPLRSRALVPCSSKNEKFEKNGLCDYKVSEYPATSSFSSIVKSPLVARPSIDHSNNGGIDAYRRKHISNGTIRSVAAEEKKAGEKLKQENGWADDTLIEDILAAFDNNEDQASMILRSMDLSGKPLSTDKEDSNSKINIVNHDERSRVESIGQLRKIHTWADDALIEDILVAVGGNEDQASLILISMCSTGFEAEDFGDNYGDTTHSGGPRQPKMSALSTKKSSKQLQRHNMGTKSKVDIYRPLLSSSSSTPPSRSRTLAHCSSKNQKSDKNGFCDYKLSELPTTRSFSSIVKMDPSANKHISNGTIRSMGTGEEKTGEKIEKLKQANGWADNTLIEDILAAVHDNEGQASMILRSMDLSANPLSTNEESNSKINITNHEERNGAESIEQLKERHVWADDALIEDILLAVGGNEDQASLILISMCPAESEAEDSGDNCGDTTLSGGPPQPKISAWSTGRSSGWTAFHQKQLQGHNVGTKSKGDTYPPFLSSSSSTPLSRSGTLPPWSSKNEKSDKNGLCDYNCSKCPLTDSFSSIVKRSLVAMPLIDHSNNGAIDRLSNKKISSGMMRRMATEEKKRAENIEKLRHINSWADDTLIEDILAAVDNNEDRASIILTSMDLSANPLAIDKHNSNSKMSITNHEERAEGIGQLKKIHTWADDALIGDILSGVGDNEDEASLLLVSMCPTVSSEAEIASKRDELDSSSEAEIASKRDELDSSSDKSLNETNQLSIDLYKKTSPPVEPEWEQHDIYLRHRKDAIRMMRLASLHSRGSRNAFSRGDHVHARQLSQRAREEWLAAEKLNQKAAQEIFRLQNKGNDIWKLDLHGLHATEAVQAVQAHLESIESLLMTGDSVFPAKMIDGKGSLKGFSSECTKSSDKGVASEELRLQLRSSRPQRQTMLEVITGSGKHSRGNAALPAAIRSFLLTNGYHFYDARPGVISVGPKFRHKEIIHGEN